MYPVHQKCIWVNTVSMTVHCVAFWLKPGCHGWRLTWYFNCIHQVECNIMCFMCKYHSLSQGRVLGCHEWREITDERLIPFVYSSISVAKKDICSQLNHQSHGLILGTKPKHHYSPWKLELMFPYNDHPSFGPHSANGMKAWKTVPILGMRNE